MTQEKSYMLNASYRAALRFEGKFTDINGVPYTMHILHKPLEDVEPAEEQEILADPTRASHRELVLGATPIILQRESERLSGLVATKARLSLLSETDGLLRYLHKLPEGAVKLVVWRSGELYYLGTLDPESYEEDYTRKNRYMVELSFSDFGCAQRLSHKFRGHKSLGTWLTLFLKASLSHAQYGMALSVLPLPTSLYIDNATLLLERSNEGLDVDLGEDFHDNFTDEIDVIANQAYISAQAFYEDEDESRTIHDCLDGVLTSLGLRLEQRAGQFVLYDTDWLLAQTPLRLKDPRADTLYVADEQYTAINIEVKSRTELYSKELEIPEVQEGIVHQHPRIDRPDLVAYNAVLKPIPKVSGAYYVTTTPKTLGERDSFIALCWQPVGYKVCRYTTSMDDYLGEATGARPIGGNFINANYRRSSGDPGEALEANYRLNGSKRWGVYAVTLMPNTPFGVERWHNLPRTDTPTNMFVPWTFRSRPFASIMLDVNSTDLPMGLEAKLFFSFMPSLYQELTEKFVGRQKLLDSNGEELVNERKLHRYFEKLRAVLMPATLILSNGSVSYALSFDEEKYQESYNGVVIHEWVQVSRHRLKWVKLSEEDIKRDTPPHFYIPFGGESFKMDSWVKASSEYVNLLWRDGQVQFYKDFWQFEAMYDKGLYIPEPPIAGVAKLELYASLLIANIQLRALTVTGIQSATPPRPRFPYTTALLFDDYTQKTLMLEWNAWLPSYVLLKDVRLSVIDTRSSKSDGDVKRHATINESAYELLKAEPIISNDEGLPANSPALIRSPFGGRVKGLYRINWETYYRDKRAIARGDFSNFPKGWKSGHREAEMSFATTSHLLASRAFEHYGERRHSLEGTFRTVQALAPLIYGEHKYMVLEEEQDVRAGKSDYKLAEISPVRYSPALQSGQVESGDNKRYIIS